MAEGIVTYGERVPADPALAARQHEAYVAALADAGWAIREVAPADELPDSAFVEDTVVVCGGLAVLARPGAPERRAEVAGTEEALRALGLEIERIEEPGTLDGGDVLRVGTHALRGPRRADQRGGDTPAPRARRATRLTVVAVPLDHVLHLKSAITALPDGTIVVADPSAPRHVAAPAAPDRAGGGGLARRPDRREQRS